MDNRDYPTKLVVIASTFAALTVEVAVTARGWPAIVPLAAAAFLVAACCSLRWPDESAGVVVLLTYLTPALLIVTVGHALPIERSFWTAALFGVVVPWSVRRPWALPSAWKVPLVLWALTVALVWPVIALRELDFWATFELSALRSRSGVSALGSVAWIAHVAAMLTCGLLWFDWLFLRFADRVGEFRRQIVGSLMVSWAVAVVAGLYQLFVRVQFLNDGLYGSKGRASGTMFDANVFGMIAALGGPAAVVWLQQEAMPSTRRDCMAVAGLLASWLAVWASGSRTSFAAAVIGLGFVLYRVRDRNYATSRRAGVLAASGAALTIGLFVAAISIGDLSGPLARFRAAAQLSSSVGSLLREQLWRRDGFGPAAAKMIHEHPLFGVGVGSFNRLSSDYGKLAGQGRLPPDNAQNWYRHQLAELGVVGSIGWVVWLCMFGWFVVSARAPEANRFSAGALRGILVALATISWLGIPAQDVAVAMTFWTHAFWFTSFVGAPAALTSSAKNVSLQWLAVAAIALVCVAGSWYEADRGLRVPLRAMRLDLEYSHGFSEPHSGENGLVQRWAGSRAVAIIASPRRWMRLTIAPAGRDVDSRPLDVRAWCNGRLILQARLTTAAPVTQFIPVPEGQSSVMLETWVDSAAGVKDDHADDARDRLLLVSWDFTDEAPPSVRTAER